MRPPATGAELYRLATSLGSVDAEIVKSAADELVALRSANRSSMLLVRQLDVALNGDGAASQASLCDVVAQVQDQRWKLVRAE